MLIDTHCHLNLAEYFPDPEAEVRHAFECGVERLVVVGIDSESSQLAADLAERFDPVFATAGIHPNHAAEFSSADLSTVMELLTLPKVLALGEIGLDYHWDKATREQQYHALDAQLELGFAKNCPIVFHCREAYGDLLDILEARKSSKTGPWLLHCFAGDAADAARAISLDCYFGVDGPLTYKNAQKLRDTVLTIPRDRVLIETDAPFLTPVPHRGKPNRPGYVSHVNSMLASLWRVSIEEAAESTTRNAIRFFGPKLNLSRCETHF